MSPHPWAAAWLLMAALPCGLGACAAGPGVSRADLPVPAQWLDPGTHAVARQVDVQGPRGRLDLAARTRLLQRIGQQGQASALQRHLAAMALFGALDLRAGNQARLLVDGPATFAAMFDQIEQARETVLLESYIIEDVEIARRLSALLVRKRAQGVWVGVLYDALGSIGTHQGFFDQLRRQGVQVCAFNPINPAQRPGHWDINHRDHRKILVVDRLSGFTGGINVSGVYASGSFGRRRAASGLRTDAGWRDTQLQITGPAAAALDDLVRDTWQRQGCSGAPPPVPKQAAAPAKPTGQAVVRIVPSSPDDTVNRTYAMLLTAVDASQRSAHFTMAYFAPGEDMIAALCEAALRGVEVRIILPSVSDFSPVLRAGQSHYTRLLKAGVRLYELQSAVLHAKTLVVDGVVSTVGSSNMDWRSFAGNNEVNAVVMGEDFGDEMGHMFMRDLAESREITLAQWRQRPWLQRAQEQLARLFERFW